MKKTASPEEKEVFIKGKKKRKEDKASKGLSSSSSSSTSADGGKAALNDSEKVKEDEEDLMIEDEDDDELIVESPEVLRARRNRIIRNTIIAVVCVLAVCGAVITIALTQKSTVSTEGVVVLVSIDAFRVDYLERTWLKIPNLRKLIANGVRTESLISSFPSKTFPVINKQTKQIQKEANFVLLFIVYLFVLICRTITQL